jgi:acetyltransferase-like isoleucine patch superfamily enzyme
MFINDKFKKGKLAKWGEWDTTHIDEGVKIGSNATILPVFICKGTTIGAGAVVTKDILEPGVYAGNPARLQK